MAGLGAPNPATYIVVPILFIGLTLAASYIPARRAAKVDSAGVTSLIHFPG